MDKLEAMAIGLSDLVLVNSKFTQTVYMKHFPHLKTPDICYPSIRTFGTCRRFQQPTILSLNRFERKKNIELAILSLKSVKEKCYTAKLIIAGGYDVRIFENVEYLLELQQLCKKLKLNYEVYHPRDNIQIEEWEKDCDVKFLLSVESTMKNELLCGSWCLFYTPANEHFGIVPLEAMSHELPVIAINNGGPKETIIDEVTGFLIETDSSTDTEQSTKALVNLLSNKEFSEKMGRLGRDHVSNRFSFTSFSENLLQFLE